MCATHWTTLILTALLLMGQVLKTHCLLSRSHWGQIQAKLAPFVFTQSPSSDFPFPFVFPVPSLWPFPSPCQPPSPSSFSTTPKKLPKPAWFVELAWNNFLPKNQQPWVPSQRASSPPWSLWIWAQLLWIHACLLLRNYQELKYQKLLKFNSSLTIATFSADTTLPMTQG